MKCSNIYVTIILDNNKIILLITTLSHTKCHTQHYTIGFEGTNPNNLPFALKIIVH